MKGLNIMFSAIGNFFVRIFTSNIGAMSALDILAVLASVYLGYVILKKLWRIIKGAKKVSYNITHYARVRCSRTQCPTCGRTLDKCVCSSNQGKSYRKRLKSYKKTRKG